MSESNSHRKVLSIDDLQPTDYNLYSEVLNEICKGIYCPYGLPEIWQSQEDHELLFIAEGHHRIYHSFQHGKQEIGVNFHCQKDSLLSKRGYSYALEEIRKKAEACREAGFFHISQLLVQ